MNETSKNSPQLNNTNEKETSLFFEEAIIGNNFEVNHGIYLEKYYKHLPLPSKELKVVTVIPAFRELENNNFWRLLSSLNRQSADQNSFEVIYVVNNTDNPKKEELDENQDHLFILNEIKSALVDGKSEDEIIKNVRGKISNFTKHEENILRFTIRKKVHIYGIDASSQGSSFNPAWLISKKIGYARDIGGHIAYERFKVLSKHDALIDFIDGDCFLPQDYYSKMLTLCIDDVILKPLNVQATEYPKMLEDEDRFRKTDRLYNLVNYYVTLLSNSRPGYFSFKTNLTKDYIGGPEIALRPEIFEAVGGYPKADYSSDFAFGKLLGTLVPIPSHLDSFVYLSDRVRDESVDGRVRSAILKGFEGQDLKTLIIELREELNSEHNKLALRLINQNRLLESSNGDVYKEIRKEEYQKEFAIGKRFQRHAKRIINIFVDLKKEFPELPIKLEDLVENETIRKKPRSLDFLNSNRLLVDELNTIYDMVKVNSKASDPGTFDFSVAIWNQLAEWLPEYFGTIPNHEPEYNIKDNLSKVKLNLRDYAHLINAESRIKTLINQT